MGRGRRARHAWREYMKEYMQRDCKETNPPDDVVFWWNREFIASTVPIHRHDNPPMVWMETMRIDAAGEKRI